VQPELISLLELQEKDRAVMAVVAQMDAFLPELEALDKDVASADKALQGAKSRVTEASERRQALEGKIESYRVMQERRRQKLEWVRGAKEASALMAEIDLARSVMAREEAEWLRSADEVTQAQATVTAADEAVTAVAEAQSERREELAASQATCQKRLNAAKRKREKQTVDVDKRMLIKYERILSGRAPLAVYALHDGACGQCYTAIPLHLRQQLQQSEGADTCEACGVMIYLAPVAAE
jgi:predicted  nucleic acid-binding Zn-ribbon protein